MTQKMYRKGLLSSFTSREVNILSILKGGAKGASAPHRSRAGSFPLARPTHHRSGAGV